MNTPSRDRMQVVEGDITRLDVDVVVNAANSSLLGGGGVDGAIHRAAGPDLLAECRTLGGCDPGDAKVTGAYDLPARWIVHTVGPVWRGGGDDEAKTLANAYRRSLEEAERLDAGTIAFPGISTGVYSYPVEAAAEVAVSTVSTWLEEHDLPERVVFCTFNAESTSAIEAALAST